MPSTRLFLRVTLAALVAAFVLWCASRLWLDLQSTSLAPVWQSWDLVLVATGLSLLNYLFRTIRWRGYLARLGHPLPFGFACLTYTSGFAFTLSPGKVGEVVRARYYTPLGIPLRDVTTAFCLERLLDALAMVALATCALTLFPSYSHAIWGVALGAGLIAVLALALPHMARASDSPLAAARLSRLPRPLARVLDGLGVALRTARPLVTPRALLVGLLLGLLAWGLEGLGLYVLSFMFPNPQLTVQVAVGIYAVAILAGVIALLPGGLGGTEAVMSALLLSQGYPFAAALLITLACRLVTLWFAVALGWAAIVALRIRAPILQEVSWRSPNSP
jgi:uncharacterized protein (TIRG00374 family)